jgi:CRP-like cAMP-binding protein
MWECESLIVQVPFFKDAERSFITQLVVKMKMMYFLDGDNVIEEGSIGDQMYFVASGSLQVIVGGISRSELPPGAFFGEIAIVLGNARRTATIKASQNCKLYSLSKADLEVVLADHPQMALKMIEVAEKRLAATKQWAELKVVSKRAQTIKTFTERQTVRKRFNRT